MNIPVIFWKTFRNKYAIKFIFQNISVISDISDITDISDKADKTKNPC